MTFKDVGDDFAEASGRYRLEGEIGEGGLTTTYLAWDRWEERAVACKVFAGKLERTLLAGFQAASDQVAAWQHDHILDVYQSISPRNIDQSPGYYMVLEYAPGGSLQKRLRPGKPLALRSGLALFQQLCSALQYAHARGVVHGNLKPSNILFLRPGAEIEGQIVVSDFGLGAGVPSSSVPAPIDDVTLPYLAPEQFRGQLLRASDIYALGCILYQLLTGSVPFAVEDVGQEIMPPPKRPSRLNPLLSPGLDAVLLRALCPDPADRYESPKEFWQALLQAANPTTQTPARRARRGTRRYDMSVPTPPVHTRSIPASTDPPTLHPPARVPGTAHTPRRRVWLLPGTALFVALLIMFVILATSGIFHWGQPGVTRRAPSQGATNSTITFTLTQSQKSTIPDAVGATPATGTLEFRNVSSTTQRVEKQEIAGKTGIGVLIPASFDLAANQTRDLVVQTAQTGANGNRIPVNDIYYYCCTTTGAGVFVQNITAFSGGRDSIPGTITQSDIDALVNSLYASLQQSAQARGSAQGKPRVSCQIIDKQSDHRVGEMASTLTVMVTVSCSAAPS